MIISIILIRISGGKRPLWRPVVDGRMILKRVVKYCVRLRTGFVQWWTVLDRTMSEISGCHGGEYDV
jgi:hypothetical protein